MSRRETVLLTFASFFAAAVLALLLTPLSLEPGSGWLYVCWVGAGISAVVAAITFFLFRREGRAGHGSEPGRIGYVGRPGSRGNLSDSQFGKDLDRGIDNQGKVDAERARFGVDFDKD